MVDLGSSHEVLRKAVFSGLEAMGGRLWHLELNRISQGYEFIIEIDAENLTAKLCEQVAKQVQASLGAEGIAKEEIFIDVSSPGLYRQLYNIAQCKEYIGSTVCCAFAKESKIIGVISEVGEDSILLELPESAKIKINFSEVSKINLWEA